MPDVCYWPVRISGSGSFGEQRPVVSECAASFVGRQLGMECSKSRAELADLGWAHPASPQPSARWVGSVGRLRFDDDGGERCTVTRPVGTHQVTGERPARPEGVDVGGAAGPGDQSNVLVNRFLANDEFAALYDAAVVELTEELFDSGAFEDTVASWSQVLVQGASDIVDAATIQAEADVLLSYVVPTL